MGDQRIANAKKPIGKDQSATYGIYPGSCEARREVMIDFQKFLNDRLDESGFTTEDALASFLPLAREALQTHQAGMVAPLCGTEQLFVENYQIYFEESKRMPIRQLSAHVRQLQRVSQSAVEVVSQTSVATDIETGTQVAKNLQIGEPGNSIDRPLYLPGFQSWEHVLECHDPLTDIFSLGMILASMALGLDLSQSQALQTFVGNRGNLFRLAPSLHPVVARAIVRMTELDRHKRPQDLDSLMSTLSSYREREVDLDFELRAMEFTDSNQHDKRTVVLRKLKNRLFDISRRNRLLQFQATMQSINLTHASVPLSFNVASIRPNQILTWSGKFESEMRAGKTVSLGNYLNFSEVLYAPVQLDRIIAETRRDKAEFGFAQLRLVICFLSWSNLKKTPVQSFESPLILLPVELTKKKGIRDTYSLQPTTTDAEVNPVVRHLFQQLYDIRLPASIPLSETSLDAFFQMHQKQIKSQQSDVVLSKVDRPRIQLLQQKAKRRLDQYRRKARLAGRGVRKFMELDYSYDPANFHPLGVKIFTTMLKPLSIDLIRSWRNALAHAHLRLLAPAVTIPKPKAKPLKSNVIL